MACDAQPQMGVTRSPAAFQLRRAATALFLLLAPVAVTALLGAAGLTAAGYLLPTGAPETPTEAIVVLGGFGVPRAELAAAMFASHAVPLVVVTGAGDCEAMRRTLVENGVPPGVIETDCTAQSTFQNAAATAKMLQGRPPACATLVTHWFHARRAIATFQKAMPETRFFASSVAPDMTQRWRLGWTSEPRAVLSEYLKVVWYAVAHGVFVRFGPEAPSGTCA